MATYSRRAPGARPDSPAITVAVLDDYHGYFLEEHASIQRLRQRAEVRVYTKALAPPKRARELREVAAIILLRERTRLDGAFFQDVPALCLISQTGRTGPHLDVEAATRAGVLVAITTSPALAATRSNSAASTVELTLALMMAIMRQIPQNDRAVRAGRWVAAPYGRVLSEKTLGVIGLGRIGRAVAQLARAFGMEVMAWSRSLTPERSAEAGVQAVGLEELLRQADVISVHLALNDGTLGFLDVNKLRLMKPEAYFINTARGALIDEAALIDLLRQRKIAGAALDVYTEEPLPANSPLKELDNVVLTPHVGWPSDAGYEAFTDPAVQNIEAYLDGQPTNIVNPEAWTYRKTG